MGHQNLLLAADCLGPHAGRIVSEASCSSAVKTAESGTGKPGTAHKFSVLAFFLTALLQQLTTKGWDRNI